MATVFVKGEKRQAMVDFMAKNPEATAGDALKVFGKKFKMNYSSVSSMMSAIRKSGAKPANAALARAASELRSKIDLPNTERRFSLDELIRGRSLISKIGDVRAAVEIFDAIAKCGGVDEALEITKAVHALDQSTAK